MTQSCSTPLSTRSAWTPFSSFSKRVCEPGLGRVGERHQPREAQGSSHHLAPIPDHSAFPGFPRPALVWVLSASFATPALNTLAPQARSLPLDSLPTALVQCRPSALSGMPANGYLRVCGSDHVNLECICGAGRQEPVTAPRVRRSMVGPSPGNSLPHPSCRSSARGELSHGRMGTCRGGKGALADVRGVQNVTLSRLCTQGSPWQHPGSPLGVCKNSETGWPVAGQAPLSATIQGPRSPLGSFPDCPSLCRSSRGST